jgi:hypothetical protein
MKVVIMMIFLGMNKKDNCNDKLERQLKHNREKAPG